MATEETRHVQTELDMEEYEAVRQLAEERGLSLKAAVHEAVVDWIDRQQRADPNDAAFTALEALDEAGLPETARTDARTEPDIVEDDDSGAQRFEVAEDPGRRQR